MNLPRSLAVVLALFLSVDGAAAEGKKGPRYAVILDDSGTSKIMVIKAIRAITGRALKDAKDLADATPSEIKTGLSKTEADAAAKQLTDVGAKALVVEMKAGYAPPKPRPPPAPPTPALGSCDQIAATSQCTEYDGTHPQSDDIARAACEAHHAGKYKSAPCPKPHRVGSCTYGPPNSRTDYYYDTGAMHRTAEITQKDCAFLRGRWSAP